MTSSDAGGPGSGWAGVAGRLERGQLHGEVAEGGTLGAGANDLQASGFCGESIEELILASTAHDVQPMERFAGDGGYVAEDLGIACGETVEEKRCELGGVTWCGVELRETAATKLRIDAIGHVAGKKQIGVVDIEGVVARSERGGLVN